MKYVWPYIKASDLNQQKKIGKKFEDVLEKPEFRLLPEKWYLFIVFLKQNDNGMFEMFEEVTLNRKLLLSFP